MGGMGVNDVVVELVVNKRRYHHFLRLIRPDKHFSNMIECGMEYAVRKVRKLTIPQKLLLSLLPEPVQAYLLYRILLIQELLSDYVWLPKEALYHLGIYMATKIINCNNYLSR